MGGRARMAQARALTLVTPERWAQIKDVVARALETADRTAFLDFACAGDPALRTEVESLLAHSAGTDSFPVARPAAGEHTLLDQALGAQYEIIRPLGRGGMGSVYLARERALERFVAIKVLRPDLAEAAEHRERFRREARVAAQLSHPGILPLHTFGEVGGLWYFVMGYVRGPSLADRLRLEGALLAGEAVRILAEVADALECAHRAGVIHRDIKPANILLDEDSGRAMLADFGISKVQGAGDSLTASGMIVGTPHFMSPEQVRGSAVNERSDIYSLGAVGYAMLTGREPFAGVSPAELMPWRVSHDAPPLPASVSPEVAVIITRSMARDPSLRWPSARAFMDALLRARDGALAVLPASMRDLPTFGPYALLWSIGWSILAFRKFGSVGDRVILLLVALVVPVGFALHLWNSERPGLSFAELSRVAFWPPEWWGMWWPLRLRRPTDLWARLPWQGRAVRRVLSAFFVLLPVMILLRQRFSLDVGESQPAWFVAFESILMVGAVIVVASAFWWSLSRGLSLRESVRLLVGATVDSPGWNEGGVVKVLRAEPGGVRAPDRDSAADHVRAIGELVALSSPVFGTEALNAARRLLADIEACDVEIASLRGVASDGELDRLSAQVALLAGQSSAAEMVSLVEQQLDLVRRMRVRSEVVSQRRSALLNLMRGLWAGVQAGAVQLVLDEITAAQAF
ncbi:MAG: protein kinase [Gemmatimonadetes bacterium]|nr:protein kinase [Gemmatimonadota bacterium]